MANRTRERVVTSGTKARMYVHRAESGHALVAGLAAVLAEPPDDPFVPDLIARTPRPDAGTPRPPDATLFADYGASRPDLTRHPFQVEQQSEGQEVYWRSFWEGEWPFYGHVLGFMGLERPAVVLAINGFRDEARAKEMLYVGLTRARDLLVVCGDIDMIKRIAGDAVVMRLTQS